MAPHFFLTAQYHKTFFYRLWRTPLAGIQYWRMMLIEHWHHRLKTHIAFLNYDKTHAHHMTLFFCQSPHAQVVYRKRSCNRQGILLREHCWCLRVGECGVEQRRGALTCFPPKTSLKTSPSDNWNSLFLLRMFLIIRIVHAIIPIVNAWTENVNQDGFITCTA